MKMSMVRKKKKREKEWEKFSFILQGVVGYPVGTSRCGIGLLVYVGHMCECVNDGREQALRTLYISVLQRI